MLRTDGFIRVFDMFLLIGFLALFGLQAPAYLPYWLADKTPPIVEFTRVDVLNNPIAPGGFIETRIYREKARDDCDVSSSRHAVGSTGVVYQLQDGEWQGGPADDSYLDFAYPTPDEIPPDEYELHVSLDYHCPNVPIPFSYDQPVARFTIE